MSYTVIRGLIGLQLIGIDVERMIDVARAVDAADGH